tara:strand:+ start:455 stop:874 length:420 start_codon:yes stop_codon:yes gene_type:complete
LFKVNQTYTSTNQQINIDSQEISGTTTTTKSGNQIRFDEAGTYLVSWNINWQSLHSGESVFGASAKLNGTSIEGGTDLQYFSASTGIGKKNTTGTAFAIEVSASDNMDFDTFLFQGTAANHKVTQTNGDDGAISVTRLS